LLAVLQPVRARFALAFAVLVAAWAPGDPSFAGEREGVRVGEPLVHARRTVPQAEPSIADALAQPAPAPDSARATPPVTDAEPARERPTVDSVERALIEAGFENVSSRPVPASRSRTRTAAIAGVSKHLRMRARQRKNRSWPVSAGSA
jgi:hypothetical protein